MCVPFQNYLKYSENNYVSWFNFGFVEKLAQVFISGNKDILAMWSMYQERLKDYFKSDNSKAVQFRNATEFGISDVSWH